MKENKKPDFDVIFAFAFGSPSDLISNTNIADRVIEARECNYLGIKLKPLPVVTQMDIAQARPLFIERPKILHEREKFFIIDDEYRYGGFEYPSTLKLVKAFRNLNKNRCENWKKVLVIAAPMHIKRCVRDLRKMGFDAYEDEYLKEKYDLPSVWWYHHNSTQWWTRSALLWWPREIFLRLLPWKIYEWISEII